MNIMELTEKIKRVEELLLLPIETNSTGYNNMYVECFGKHWNGCSCNKNALREALKQWLLKNKEELNKNNSQ